MGGRKRATRGREECEVSKALRAQERRGQTERSVTKEGRQEVTGGRQEGEGSQLRASWDNQL